MCFYVVGVLKLKLNSDDLGKCVEIEGCRGRLVWVLRNLSGFFSFLDKEKRIRLVFGEFGLCG